jgi:hypothetical protein
MVQQQGRGKVARHLYQLFNRRCKPEEGVEHLHPHHLLSINNNSSSSSTEAIGSTINNNSTRETTGSSRDNSSRS